MSQFTNEDLVQVSGTVLVDGSATTQPVSGTVTANAGTGPFPVSDNGGSLTVDGTVSISGTVATTVGGTALATVTNVSVGTSPTTLSASNANKTRVVIFNETGTLYVKLGSGASSTSYTTRLTANTLYEITGYTGIISATKQTGTTPVLVTEVGI